MTTMIALTAEYLYLIIILIGIITFFFLKNKKDFLLLIIPSFILSYIISKILNKLISSPRPMFTEHIKPLIKVSTDNGFPSDHVLLSMSIALVIFVYNKKIGAVLIALAIIVGIARVLAHAHHPIDVIGSILIALFSTVVIYFIGKKIILFSKSENTISTN